MFKCDCGKEFNNELSLTRHQKWHDPEYRNKIPHNNNSNRDTYYLNPKKCLECQSVIQYEQRLNKFCNSSCSASHNNKKIPKRKANTRPCKNCGTIINARSTFCNMACNLSFRRMETKKLVESGEASSGQVKQYLIDKHGEICLDSNCAWDFNKRPIKVELEHINGNSEDNRLENLTLLCPNCHSLTPTYKSKNKGNGRANRRERYRAGKSF